MKSGSDASKEEDASGSGGGQPGNGNGNRSGKPPHWKRRERTATAVYVVHPALFRTVVQQLTGPASLPPPQFTHEPHQHQHQHQRVAAPAAAGGGGGNGAGAGRRSNVAAQAEGQQQHGGGVAEESSGGGGSSSWGRTLGQMHQDCLAWANADDN